MNISRRLLAVGLASMAGVTALVLPAGASPAAGQGTGSVLVGRGSDTTYEVMKRLGNLYNSAPTQEDGVTSENKNGDRVQNRLPQGSSVGIDQLCRQGESGVPETGFARSSRGPREGDCENLKFVAFARDGIIPVNFRELPNSPAKGVESLTRAQLRGIFVTCTITNWKQVGGSDGRIIVYTAQEGSGTRATFDDLLVGTLGDGLSGDSSSCIPARYKDGDQSNGERVVFENNVQPILDAGDAPRAIFYLSFGRFVKLTDTNIAQIAVNGVPATAATIEDQSYPFNRELYNVYYQYTAANTGVDPSVRQAAERFLGPTGWICKPPSEHTTNPRTGQNYGETIDRIIREEGFVPIDCEVKTT